MPQNVYAKDFILMHVGFLQKSKQTLLTLEYFFFKLSGHDLMSQAQTSDHIFKLYKILMVIPTGYTFSNPQFNNYFNVHCGGGEWQ